MPYKKYCQYLMCRLTYQDIQLIKKEFKNDKKIKSVYYGKDQTLYNQYVLFVYYNYPCKIPQYSKTNPISESNMKVLYASGLVAKMM